MEIGIDRFVFADTHAHPDQEPVEAVLEEIEFADRMGIHVFGIGEHHTAEFMDSSPAVLLAAAAGRTRAIRLTSAISVLSAGDPVRLYEDFATLDLVSRGRAEIIVGRGAYAEAFSLFGLDVRNYDSLFEDKLGLLLALREGGPIEWSGRHRPALRGQSVTPTPVQPKLPVWIGATGSPESFARAGALGLPLALGVVGGDFSAYRPLLDLYREAGFRAGHDPENLTVGVHAIGYLAEDTATAVEEFFPAYSRIFGEIAQRMGRPAPTLQSFIRSCGPSSALIVGSPSEVGQKIRHIDRLLGGISRMSLQMSVGPLARVQRLKSIELLAREVGPALGGSRSLIAAS